MLRSTCNGVPKPRSLKLWAKCLDGDSFPNLQLILPIEPYSGNNNKDDHSNKLKSSLLSPSKRSSFNSKNSFCEYQWGKSSDHDSYSNIPFYPPLVSLEAMKREKALTSLRKSNREMKNLLAQLRIPKTDVLTLERPVSLDFEGLLHEIVIVLLPQDLSKLEISLGMPKPMIGEYYKAKITSLFKNKKSLE